MKRINEPAGDTGFPVYQCRLPALRRTNEYCTDLLSRHLKKIGSRWRALPPGRIVIIVLAVLRHDQRIADMAGGNAVGDTTVRRWRDELISLLAARAPRLLSLPISNFGGLFFVGTLCAATGGFLALAWGPVNTPDDTEELSGRAGE
ncbi:hypothetical protein OG426_04740 [Streptomyces canus]|uniref:hypothetical protein n=1 Tax=Streptomyces canus TaxID=58343 RepID=UPI0038686F22|nr:hypothetical protein OG426_04740 [Streptomyces canus]